jgi:hypothetical protein
MCRYAVLLPRYNTNRHGEQKRCGRRRWESFLGNVTMQSFSSLGNPDEGVNGVLHGLHLAVGGLVALFLRS